MNTAKHIRNLFALSIAAIAFTACGKEERIAPAPSQYASEVAKPFDGESSHTAGQYRTQRFEKEHIESPTYFAKPSPVISAVAPTAQVEKIIVPQTIGTQLHVATDDFQMPSSKEKNDDSSEEIEWPSFLKEAAPYIGIDND